MRAGEFVSEKWSAKYKRSINCARPRGFSQKAHCVGRKKNEGAAEEGYGTHPSQRVDPRTGKKYVPPKSPIRPSEADREHQLAELTFRGSECTQDCSGHRAGHEWYGRNGRTPVTLSPSFNKGAAIAAAGQ